MMAPLILISVLACAADERYVGAVHSHCSDSRSLCRCATLCFWPQGVCTGNTENAQFVRSTI